MFAFGPSCLQCSAHSVGRRSLIPASWKSKTGEMRKLMRDAMSLVWSARPAHADYFDVVEQGSGNFGAMTPTGVVRASRTERRMRRPPTMLVAWVALVLAASAGCRRPPQLIVPNTADGLACARTCQQTFFMCRQSCRSLNVWADLACGSNCGDVQQNCLSTCPGAHWVQQQESVPAESSGGIPGPKPYGSVTGEEIHNPTDAEFDACVAACKAAARKDDWNAAFRCHDSCQ